MIQSLILMNYRFIDWDLQEVYDDAGQEVLPRPAGDPVAEERLRRWTAGTTGYSQLHLPGVLFLTWPDFLGSMR